MVHNYGRYDGLFPNTHCGRGPRSYMFHCTMGKIQVQALQWDWCHLEMNTQHQTVKIVDDVLVCDFTYHVTSILEPCDKLGITVNPKKFSFIENSVEFCGYSISQEEYAADREKWQPLQISQNLKILPIFVHLWGS